MAIDIKEKIPLRGYTTLKVGGEAQYFVTVSTEPQLVEAVAFAQKRGLQVRVLAGGSNTLVPDEGVEGLVIHMALKGMHSQINGSTVHLSAAAGEVLDEVVAYTVEQGWWGLENLSSIPGSVGATPVQNVGAYGVETKDVLVSVRALDTQRDQFVELSAEACAFGYRDSLFKKEAGKKFIITEVTYQLSSERLAHLSYRDLAHYFENDPQPSQKEIREAVMKIRSQKFPDWSIVGTAGSFFKNPIVAQTVYENLKEAYPQLPGFPMEKGYVKLPLGWILDKVLGVKGYKKGNIGSYAEQALVLIAEEGATANEIKSFANEVVARVKEKMNIDVEWEVSVM